MAKKDIQSHTMTLDRRVKLSVLSGFLFMIVIGAMLAFSPRERTEFTETSQQVSQYSQTAQERDYFAYQGQENKDALAMLKELATIEQDRSGLVVSINGRKADSSMKEYWSFFVNGKKAQVGPAEYQTNSGDQIEWRIEAY